MRHRRGIGLLVVIALAIAPLLLAFLPARAQSGFNLQISPLPIELTAKPGSTTSTELRVRNAGSSSEKLQVRLLKVTEDNNGEVQLTQPTSTDPWTKWVSFDRQTFDAPPNTWQTVHMTVNLPSDAAFGYYFAVEYTRASDPKPQPGRAATRGAVATFILLNADAPGAKRDAKIESFSADKKMYEFLPATFSVKIHAAGNVHVAPHGNVFISRGGKQIATLSMNQAQGNVLPNSSRYFATAWEDSFPHYVPKVQNGKPAVNEDGTPKRSLKWDFSKVNHLRFVMSRNGRRQ